MNGELRPTGTPRDTFQSVEATIPLPSPGFVVGIPTLNRFDLLPSCIDAILAGSVLPVVQGTYQLTSVTMCTKTHRTFRRQEI